MGNFQHTQAKGFTLIELLIVVSIIALLIAILLPAIRQARLTAQAAVCMNHQKQIGWVWMAYAFEYDDYLPRWWDPNHLLTWSEMLVYEAKLLPEASDVFYCPSSYPDSYGVADQVSTRPLALGYGTPQYWRDPNAEFMLGFNSDDYMKLSAMDSPSTTFLIVDSFDAVVGVQRYDINSKWPPECLIFHRINKNLTANILIL